MDQLRRESAADQRFSIWRFAFIAQVASVLVGGAVGPFVAGAPAGWGDLLLRSLLGGIFGWIISGAVYLALVVREIRTLTIPAEELNKSEVLLFQTPGSAVHYRNGRPGRFWEAIGGKLFLTNQVLEFRAHHGQLWVYCLTIPLQAIADVRSFISVSCPGGLRVEKIDGSFELFNLGIMASSTTWSTRINGLLVQQAEPQLHPERSSSR